MSNTTRGILSRSSVFLSSVCLIHCMATPFLVLALPSFSVFFTDAVEWALILAVVPVSLAAFVPTWLKHKDRGLLLRFLAGLTFVLVSQFLFHQHHHSVVSLQWPGMVSMAIGAFLMAWAIYRNNRHTHVCTVPGHAH
jgi:uncharacterized membrane protein YeaQ/YmgE (transglycosylase-associated protein family)